MILLPESRASTLARFVFDKKQKTERKSSCCIRSPCLRGKKEIPSQSDQPNQLAFALNPNSSQPINLGTREQYPTRIHPKPHLHAIHAGGKGERPSPGPVPNKAGRHLPGRPARRRGACRPFCKILPRPTALLAGASRISEKAGGGQRKGGMHAADSAAPNGSTTLVLFKLSRSFIQKAKSYTCCVCTVYYEKHCTLLCFTVETYLNFKLSIRTAKKGQCTCLRITTKLDKIQHFLCVLWSEPNLISLKPGSKNGNILEHVTCSFSGHITGV
jgi:hypothetical protein